MSRELHPIFGRTMCDDDTCSRCGHTIPGDQVPLILRSRVGNQMWVYCGRCEAPVIEALVALKRRQDGSAANDNH